MLDVEKWKQTVACLRLDRNCSAERFVNVVDKCVEVALAQDREEREKKIITDKKSAIKCMCGALIEIECADTLSADLVRIQEHWTSFNFYPLDGVWFIEDVADDGITIQSVTGDTPKAAAKAALQEIGLLTERKTP